MNEQEARIKIGDRMCKRLDIINSFLKHFGYGIWLHSTSPSSAQKIIKEQDGLRLNLNEKSFGYTYESKQALLENIDVPDEYLKQLEETAKNNPGVQVKIKNIFPRPGRKPLNIDSNNILQMGFIGGNFREDPQMLRATVVNKRELTAKDMVEHNHMGHTATLIGIYPMEPHPKYREIYGILDNRYMVRCTIYCIFENGEYTYEVRTEYPNQSILCAYDREKNKILMNNNFDETFLLIGDSTKKTNGAPKKGMLQARIQKELNELNEKNER